MPDALITLTTDFGEGSPYVAAMKGVIASINVQARILDLSHRVPPQDLRHAAFFLSSAIPYFPPGVLHVAVVDPGVGSARALLYVEVGGHRLLVPDNGCWTVLADDLAAPPLVIHLKEPRYWRHPVSATFHGRDILAPVAAHLSLGALTPDALGPRVQEWVRLPVRPPVVAPDRVTGEVMFVDQFGNLITNISAAELAPHAPPIQIGDHVVTRWVNSYFEAEAGTPVALISSNGKLEIAVNQGHAAQQLRAGVGTRIVVSGRVVSGRVAGG